MFHPIEALKQALIVGSTSTFGQR
uniref:Uncharacterized protein n=1 Tax=Lepeophtheirus salmonis TaxID=72036 RepID=A0A0K2SVU1_LEPSM